MSWILLTGLALAQDQAAPAESRKVQADTVLPEAEEPRAVSFLGLVQTKASATNVVTTNPFFDGQVVGVLDGTAGATTSTEDTTWVTEQRVVGFLGYAPPVLGGKAGLTAAFEVDFAWGDAAYGIGGNTGGGFGADQVNLQTRRLHADFHSSALRHEQHTVVGLQFVGDGAADPMADSPADLLRSGGRLMVFGSEAAGVSVYGRVNDGFGERLGYRLGAYTLVENASAQPDDVALFMADVQGRPAYRTSLGLHAWVLRDRSAGQGGALGVGPGSALSELQGASSLDVANADADLAWLGADAGFNHDLAGGPVGVTGLAIANLGTVRPEDGEAVGIQGALLDAEARWRWTAGEGSVLRAEVLYVTGDSVSTPTYTGFVTGNAYGIAGAVHNTHGTVLLHPDVLSINRQVSHVGDVAAGGRGMVSASADLGYDPIPDRLTVSVGGAHAAFGGDSSAQELHARVVGQPLLFLRTGLTGAYLARPSTAADPNDAWAVYAHLDWLVF